MFVSSCEFGSCTAVHASVVHVTIILRSSIAVFIADSPDIRTDFPASLDLLLALHFCKISRVAC